jgi:hypothetical protein
MRDIAREEMLHMTLVCNLMNAIGGQPRLSDPAFMLSYPTHLPGAIQNDLIVPLEPFSRKLVETVFLEIEEPEHPKVFPTFAAEAEVRTIGQFYAQISRTIQDMGPGLFVGDPARQLMITIDDDDSFLVSDVESACRAIDLIVSQGEGTPTSPLEARNGQPAHYYRFMEILKGRTLVADPSVPEGYSYSGPEIPFDANGVFSAKPNIKVADLPTDSPARQLAEQFNHDYTTMLGELHRAVNGEPNCISDATNRMVFALKPTALQLMQIEIEPGVRAGPTFEFASD